MAGKTYPNAMHPFPALAGMSRSFIADAVRSYTHSPRPRFLLEDRHTVIRFLAFGGVNDRHFSCSRAECRPLVRPGDA